MARSGIVSLIAALVVGIFIGSHAFSTTKVEREIVTYPEEVVKVKTVKVPVTPDGCDDLVRYASAVRDAGGTIDSITSDVLDIMSRLRIAAARGDASASAGLETELRVLTGNTIGAVETLGLSDDQLADAAQTCTQEIN